MLSHVSLLLNVCSFHFDDSIQIVFVFVSISVWEKLKTQKQGERWIPEQEEEFEDSQGNVVNKKTYEDLKRQGLL